jgi:hypothetical protein
VKADVKVVVKAPVKVIVKVKTNTINDRL